MSPPRRLRITGGAMRGLLLQAPAAIRPSSGRLREALFSLWADRLAGCRFLDLFAGSGAVGIEAASRGAARVVLVEGDRRVFAVLESNCRRARPAALQAVRARLPEQLGRGLAREERFDLVFADPPYAFTALTDLLTAVGPWLAPAGEIALEHRWRDGPPTAVPGFEALRSRRYGDSALTLLRRPSPR